VKKNNNVIAEEWSSITDFAQTTSVTVVEQLTVNDIVISVSATGGLYVFIRLPRFMSKIMFRICRYED
jgi:predicted Zn-dependent protease